MGFVFFVFFGSGLSRKSGFYWVLLFFLFFFGLDSLENLGFIGFCCVFLFFWSGLSRKSGFYWVLLFFLCFFFLVWTL